MSTRPRPLVTTAVAQSPFAATSLLSGPGYLVALDYAGLPIDRVDVLIALGLCAVTAGGPVWALVKTVLNGEKRVTPVGAEQNAGGQELVPVEQALMARALVVADNTPTAPAATAAPAAANTTGTSRFPDLSQARPMRAADSTPDWVGDHVREYEESWARRSADPQVRAGRAIADHRDRRAAGGSRAHRYRDER